MPAPSAPVDVLLLHPRRTMMYLDAMLPLGLASLAAMTERHGFSTGVVDLNRYDGDLRRDLPRWRPKIVGIGGTTPTRHDSFALAALVKRVLPATTTVYGGTHASFTAEDTLRHVPAIDIVVQGEGEYPFVDLCRRHVRGEPMSPEAIDGIAYRSNGDLVIRPEARRIDDLDALPLPARHLFDDVTLTLDFTGLPADFIITSRGCPVSCTFCSASRMFPGGVRLRGMDSVRAELEQIVSRKHIRGLKVFDSTFTAVRSHVLAFCETVAPFGLQWECEVRADSVDPELFRAMKAAGCYYVDMGLETTNQPLLDRLAKRITVQQAEQALIWAREAGLRTKLFMIFGLYRETFRDCLDDLRFLRRHRHLADLYANTIGLKVFPGTSLEKRLLSDGVLPEGFSWARYRAPFKKWWLLESGDYFILDQPGLRLRHLALLSFLLFLQRTNLSTEWVGRFIRNSIRGILRWAWTIVRGRDLS